MTTASERQDKGPDKAVATPKQNRVVTISATQGEAWQTASGLLTESDTFHSLFCDEWLRYPSGAWTPCPMRDGKRDNTHALPCNVLALDFDDPGCSIDAVRGFFCDCDYVVYTTRNHQRDKHGVTCDRFRIVAPIDREIDPACIPAVIDWFGERLSCDTACKDGARFFFTGGEGSQIYRNHGGAVSADWLLSLVPATPSSGPTVKPVRAPRKAIVLSDKKAHSKHVSFLREAWPNCADDHTHQRIFSLCLLWIQRFGLDLAALKAALPKVQEIADFYSRKPGQWQSIDDTLERALACVSNADRNALKHRTDVVAVDLGSVAEDIEREAIFTALQAETLTGSPSTVFLDSATLFAHTVANYSKAVIDVQCGRGKSVVASFAVATSGRWLIVKDTVQACRVERDRLLQYGALPADIQVISGWTAEGCSAALAELAGRKWGRSKRAMLFPRIKAARALIPMGWTPFYSKVSSPCETCWATCDFRQSRTHRKVAMALQNKRVVIMTHARFLELAHWGAKALEGRRIIIDEEPSLFESVAFGSKEIETLLAVFKGVLSGKVEQHLKGLREAPTAGTIEDHCCYDRAEIKTLQGRASGQDQSTKDLCYRYIRFYSYEAQRFAFVERDLYGKKVSAVRNRLNFDLPNDVYVLNASSCFGLARWEGFTAVRDASPATAEGVCVNAYEANSTKHRMAKEAEAYLSYALEVVRRNNRKRVLLAVNKAETQTEEMRHALAQFRTQLQGLGVTVSEGERGSIIGRNDWRDCDAVVLAYGLFTSLSNVALKASLVEGCAIAEDRIWESKTVNGEVVRQPRISGRGVVDQGLRDVDRRLFADEVYQTGLRGVARNWRGEGMDVIVAAPAMDYLLPLRQVLPGCSIKFEGVDLESFRTEDLLKGDIELRALFGITAKSDQGSAQARTLAKGLLAGRLSPDSPSWQLCG